mmetsp:Transcript_39072/g.76184  ORF Transcript_39072/g.76184 Transcript_39072/m.76184 type:complete len:522 (-) Transcript_39072:113-1678(-)|eukprot:CAMPEP_0194314570 /NCGR_PEP_ID=MMETSP0171-20130528/11422_1 /TAXON_ID=218684 /ORGANISM="Corethron pennatum, Strain L29A3" /LENGTH=521 /DNA_ID=CAMNT_0039070045 /DNA_START=55 /DNA_END=1620 /DNA_ORIENTATION=+
MMSYRSTNEQVPSSSSPLGATVGSIECESAEISTSSSSVLVDPSQLDVMFPPYIERPVFVKGETQTAHPYVERSVSVKGETKTVRESLGPKTNIGSLGSLLLDMLFKENLADIFSFFPPRYIFLAPICKAFREAALASNNNLPITDPGFVSSIEEASVYYDSCLDRSSTRKLKTISEAGGRCGRVDMVHWAVHTNGRGQGWQKSACNTAAKHGQLQLMKDLSHRPGGGCCDFLDDLLDDLEFATEREREAALAGSGLRRHHQSAKRRRRLMERNARRGSDSRFLRRLGRNPDLMSRAVHRSHRPHGPRYDVVLFDWTTCIAAVEGNQKFILEWMFDVGYSAKDHNSSQRITSSAAQTGNMEMLQWLVSKGCECGTRTYYAAARKGQADIMRWLYDVQGCRPDAEDSAAITASIVLRGKTELLELAREHGCRWDYRTCKNAAMKGHLKILMWAREEGCEWDCNTTTYAAKKGHIEVFQWSVKNRCPVDLEKIESLGKKEIKEWYDVFNATQMKNNLVEMETI